MIETVDDLLNELVKYPMDTKIRVILKEEEIVPALYKIDKINEVKMSAETSHLEIEIDS